MEPDTSQLDLYFKEAVILLAELFAGRVSSHVAFPFQLCVVTYLEDPHLFKLLRASAEKSTSRQTIHTGCQHND